MARRTTTRRAALGLIATGSLAVAAETFGFSRTNAARTVGVTSADDPNALLGIDGYATSSETPTLTNNAGESMSVTLDSAEDVEFDVGANGNWAAPPVTVSLAVAESRQVDIRWVGDCVGAGSAVVSTNATLTDGTGAAGEIAFEREWEIPEAGQVQFEGTAKAAGGSGKYEFTLQNTGCEDVTFTGIGINETTAAADYVSGGGSLYNNDTGDAVVTDRIPIDNSDPTSDTRRDMNPTVTLPQNDTVNFEFQRFKQESNGNGNDSNVNMQSEDVRITLYFGDGSSATETLCLDGCTF